MCSYNLRFAAAETILDLDEHVECFARLRTAYFEVLLFSFFGRLLEAKNQFLAVYFNTPWSFDV